MKRQHQIALLAGTAILPGILAFAIVKMVVSPAESYKIVPPDPPRQVEQMVIHGRQRTADTNQPSFTMPASNVGMFAQHTGGGGDGQRPSPSVGSNHAQTSEQSHGTTGSNMTQAESGMKLSANRRQGGGWPAGMSQSGTFALVRLFTGIGRLEEDGQHACTPAQAKAILALMTPLRSQATLTPQQALRIQTKLEAILTSAQKDAIANARRAGGPQGFGGRPQGGGENMGGMRPADGERRPGPEGQGPMGGGREWVGPEWVGI
ncbi:MAG TPA: hypothetical protein VHV83_04415 [Armatimonadota bacterium]|nr:hypothetical protein [Armatimonadota bacterium]